MYDFKIAAADKATMYRDLASALEGLVAGETDAVANMANAAALIWETLPDLNWAGFYRISAAKLVVGPFHAGRRASASNSARASAARGSNACSRSASTMSCVRRPYRLRRRVGQRAVVPIVRDGELLCGSTSTAHARAVRCAG